MSIIYSYPTSQPTVDDLVIGTSVGDDNATKSFVLGDIVTLINAESGSGTLTGVTIFTDAFITAIGNPTGPAVSYTIGLSATGTPSATTFLRGDNQWVVPTVSAGIEVSSNNLSITNDVGSFNFIGNGVTSQSDPFGNVTINVPGPEQAVDSLLSGAGISVNQATGDVIVSNTGILSIAQGPGILSSVANGIATISAIVTSEGTVTSASPGSGIKLEGASVSTINPILGINYEGTQNFILTGVGKGIATALATDTILFNQTSSNNVKSTTFGDIQASTLALVNESVQVDLSSTVKNNLDTYNSVGTVQQIISLTLDEYNLIPVKNGNALYVINDTGGVTPTTFTKTLAINTAGITGGPFTITGDQIGDTRTGVTGTAWSFSSSASPGAGYYFTSGPSGGNISGTQDGTNSTVTSTITGTLAVLQPNTCTSTLSISLASSLTNSGAQQGVDFTLTYSGSLSKTGTCTTALNPQSIWAVNVSLITGAPGSGIGTDKFQISTPIGYNYQPSSGTYATGAYTCSVSGAITLKTYNLQYNITDGITLVGGIGGIGTSYNIATSGTFTSNSNQLTFSVNLLYGTAYNVASVVSADSGYILSNPTYNPSSSQSGTITADTTLALTIGGQVSESTGSYIVNNVVNNINGTNYTAVLQSNVDGAGFTNITENQAYVASSGASVDFRYVFTIDSGYIESPALSASFSVNPISIVGGSTLSTSPTLTGSVSVERNAVGIAGQGGSPGTGPDPNPSCSYSITSTAYTESDITNGVSTGMILYNGPTGTIPYGGNSQSYRCNSVNIGGSASVGYVTFGSGGVIIAVGTC